MYVFWQISQTGRVIGHFIMHAILGTSTFVLQKQITFGGADFES
jgi:hypothetical protein